MKPRVAFFDFTGCEGCQLEVLNFNLEIVDLIGAVPGRNTVLWEVRLY